MRYLLLLLGLCGYANAHELTPTYPELKNSYVPGVLKATVNLWNGRADIKYFSVEVSDADWNDVQFITSERLIMVEYLQHRQIEIFLPEDTTATYICTRSMILAGNAQKTMVSSKVCSKIK